MDGATTRYEAFGIVDKHATRLAQLAEELGRPDLDPAYTPPERRTQITPPSPPPAPKPVPEFYIAREPIPHAPRRVGVYYPHERANRAFHEYFPAGGDDLAASHTLQKAVAAGLAKDGYLPLGEDGEISMRMQILDALNK